MANPVTGPSIGGQIIIYWFTCSAYLILAAEQDRKRAFVPDARDYQSAVDIAYGGQLAPPPEDRRVRNLFPVAAAARRYDGRRANKWFS